MSRRDWGKIHTRTLVQRQGTEGANEPTNFMQPLLTRRPPVVRRQTKAQMRAEAQAAVDAWKRKR